MSLLSNPLVIIGIGIGFALIIAVGLFGIFLLLNPSRTASDRLSEMTGGPGADEPDPAAAAIAERLSKLANPSDEEEKNLLRLKLVQAGYRDPRALEMFNGLRVAAAMGLPILASPILALQAWYILLGGVLVLAAGGYFVPMMLVNSRLADRQAKLLKPFADALDLLTTSVEAGLGVDAAFRRVAEQLDEAAPELSAEFQYVNHEISAGVTRIDALKHLASRTGLDEVRSLVNMLTQAERFGTSIARSLRIHSDLMRQKRMSRAEEAAAKVSPKLTVVMILFLLPCLFIVVLGPAMIRVKQAFLD